METYKKKKGKYKFVIKPSALSGPADYLYVYIYSWECYGEHGEVFVLHKYLAISQLKF